MVSALAEALMPVLEILGAFLGGVFKGILTSVSALFDGLAIVIEWLTPLINWLVDGFKAISPVLADIMGGVGFVIGLFTKPRRFDNWTWFKKTIISTAWTNIQSVFTTSKSIIGVISFLKGDFSALSGVGNALKTALSTAWNFIKTSISNAGSGIKGTIDTIKNLFNSLKNIDLSGG